MSLFLLHFHVPPRHLHSFPTRRSSDLVACNSFPLEIRWPRYRRDPLWRVFRHGDPFGDPYNALLAALDPEGREQGDRKSTRLNSSHLGISYAVFCLKKKNKNTSNKQPN